MSNEVFFSLVVPVYNTQSYLSDCIQSCLNQTHKNFELILVDDGSSDGSLEIARGYAASDERVLIIKKKNFGQSSSRNTSIAFIKDSPNRQMVEKIPVGESFDALETTSIMPYHIYYDIDTKKKKGDSRF